MQQSYSQAKAKVKTFTYNVWINLHIKQVPRHGDGMTSSEIIIQICDGGGIGKRSGLNPKKRCNSMMG